MGGTRWGSPRSSPLLIVRDLRKLSSLHPVRPAHLPTQPSVAGVVREASRLVRGHSASPSRGSKGRKGRKADLMDEILMWPSPPGCQPPQKRLPSRVHGNITTCSPSRHPWTSLIVNGHASGQLSCLESMAQSPTWDSKQPSFTGSGVVGRLAG